MHQVMQRFNQLSIWEMFYLTSMSNPMFWCLILLTLPTSIRNMFLVLGITVSPECFLIKWVLSIIQSFSEYVILQCSSTFPGEAILSSEWFFFKFWNHPSPATIYHFREILSELNFTTTQYTSQQWSTDKFILPGCPFLNVFGMPFSSM